MRDTPWGTRFLLMSAGKGIRVRTLKTGFRRFAGGAARVSTGKGVRGIGKPIPLTGSNTTTRVDGFSGHAGMCFGTLWGGFRMGLRGCWEQNLPRSKIKILKSVWEYCSCVGALKTIMFSLLPDQKYKQISKHRFYTIGPSIC